MEDSEIISLYLDRNEDAISQTEVKYGNYCRKIAVNILNSIEDSKECVNDTYLKAWNSIPPQIPNILRYFLAKITRNLAINRYEYNRAKKRDENVELVYEELENCISSEDMQKDIEYNELVECINNFLGTLSPQKREIFIERYWYFLSIKQISEKHNQRESKTKMMLLRVRDELKNYLEERWDSK